MFTWLRRSRERAPLYVRVPTAYCVCCDHAMSIGVCPQCVQKLLDTLLAIVRHPECCVDLAELVLEEYYKVEPDEITEQMQRAIDAIHRVADMEAKNV